jgi:ATP-dependent DNA helicase RecQ
LYPDDQRQRQFFVDKMRSQYQRRQQLAQKLPVQGEVATVSRQFRDGAIALALLHSSGQVEWQDPFHYRKHLSGESRTFAHFECYSRTGAVSDNSIPDYSRVPLAIFATGFWFYKRGS